MLKYNLILFALITFNFAQTYCAGDQISVSDQNSTHLVGAGYGDFSAGDEFKLADWNGELNGGNYSVIFIDMSASW